MKLPLRMKFVMKASQWRNLEMPGRRSKGMGALNMRIASFAGNSKRQSFSTSECIIRIRPVSADTLLRGPGCRFLNTSPNLTASHIRNLGYIEKPLDKDIQEMLEPTTMRRTKTILNLERIEEEAITPKGTVVQPPVGDQEVYAPQEQSAVLETTNKEQEMDISELPTQVLRKSVPQKRQAREEQHSPVKKSRIDSSDQNKIIEKDPKEKSSFQDLPVPDATASQTTGPNYHYEKHFQTLIRNLGYLKCLKQLVWPI
ncbi:hypothetical protein EVAR_14772_1 [Eumeta japonica]|uniref:Uncharacterized protein n=1 Tax=Eumeta variegata TaxID=151549 RepID=A0A4C1TWG8_EUMVA|nr:hypothetical protein EVAR_14772_1 [Eumeta japonica]